MPAQISYPIGLAIGGCVEQGRISFGIFSYNIIVDQSIQGKNSIVGV